MNLHTVRAILACLIATGLLSCSKGSAEPANLGQLKEQEKHYHDSGDYDRDLASDDAQAQAYLDTHLAGIKKPAIVLDIDETSLSNWEEIVANDFAYFPDGQCQVVPLGRCGSLAWDKLGKARAIAPTLALFNHAKSKGVAVFFITGRHELERLATEANLCAVGYRGWAELHMVPDDAHPHVSDFKTGERQKIKDEGYNIVINVGDQDSDLKDSFPARPFKLPNPFYFIP